MSFPRVTKSSSVDGVQHKVAQLNDLSKAAFLKFTEQLELADISKKDDIKKKKKIQNDANDRIDALLRDKILAVDSDLKNLANNRSELRAIIDKRLSNIALNEKEEAKLKLYKIDQPLLDKIAPEKEKLDQASRQLFAIEVKVPQFTPESVAARPALAGYVSYDILSAENDNAKAKAINQWSQVMKQMLRDGNYYGAHVIFTALRDDNIKNTQAMELADNRTQRLLARAEKIFANNKSLMKHMKISAWLKKPIIPCLIFAEKGLVGCADKSDLVSWNAIVSRVQEQAALLKKGPTPELTGELTSALLNGQISSHINLTMEKSSKHDIAMINVVESHRKLSVKSEGFNDLNSIKSNILTKLAEIQAFVDSKPGSSNASLQQLINTSIDAIKTFSDLINAEKQQQVITMVNDVIAKGLNDKQSSIVTELGELFGKLNRKMQFIAVNTQDLSAKDEPVKSDNEKKTVSQVTEEKPMYIGPRYVQSHLLQMRNIFNQTDNSYVHERADEINKAISFMLKQRKLRKHQMLFDPLNQTKEQNIAYMQKLQDKKDQLHDNLPEEIKQAKILHQVIEVLRDNGGNEQDISKLITCFNKHMKKMSLDAITHPDVSLQEEIRVLKISRVAKVVAVITEVADSTLSPKERKSQNNANIRQLEQQRAEIINQHYERQGSVTSKVEGKQEMPDLGQADKLRISAIDGEILRLHEDNNVLRNHRKISNVTPQPTMQSVSVEPVPAAKPVVNENEKQDVTKSRKSTIMRMLGGVKTLFAKDKLPSDNTKRRSNISDDKLPGNEPSKLKK